MNRPSARQLPHVLSTGAHVATAPGCFLNLALYLPGTHFVAPSHLAHRDLHVSPFELPTKPHNKPLGLLAKDPVGGLKLLVRLCYAFSDLGGSGHAGRQYSAHRKRRVYLDLDPADGG